MPSQFFGLNIAYTGLLASNAALNTTANNIANVQTEGFSRQKVTQQAADALRVFQTYGCAGAGVETLAIERIRDEFYDMRYWNNNAYLGDFAQKQYYMKQIEAYFDDNGQNAGFKTVFDQFMITGLQELMKHPDDPAFKEQFLGHAGSLAEYFNSVAANLGKVQEDANEEIKVKVDEINSIASEIATLNKQINTIEITGQWANELRDRRDLLVDQLSEIVDVEIKETQMGETVNPQSGASAHRYMVKIAGGQVLVDGYEYNALECVARTADEKVNQSDIEGLYDVYWKLDAKEYKAEGASLHDIYREKGTKFNLYNGSMRGALKGLVDIRDGNNNENFSGTVTSVDRDKNTVTVEVGKHYLTDLNKCNLSDNGGIINLGNREYYYDSWTYTASYNDAGELVYSYTFQLSDVGEDGLNTSRVTGDREGKLATIGNSISYQGVPYYMSQMNEWIRTFSQKFNDIMNSGFSEKGPGIDLFAGNELAGDGQYVFEEAYRYDLIEEKVAAMAEAQYQGAREAKKKLLTDGGMSEPDAEAVKQQLIAGGMAAADAENRKQTLMAGGLSEEEAEEALQALEPAMRADAEAAVKANFSMSITVGKDVTYNDSYYLLTAKNCDVSSTIENDPSLIATKKKESDGPEQNDLLEEVKKLATDKGTMSFRGGSASEFLQCILGDVALNTSRAETFYDSYADIATTIETQRISISGVDEDEEAVSLVKYQNGYNLASKMIQILTEVYDRLILETGV